MAICRVSTVNGKDVRCTGAKSIIPKKFMVRGDEYMELWDAYDRNLEKIEGMTLIRGEKIPEGVSILSVMSSSGTRTESIF